jgi:hypothetical protein
MSISSTSGVSHAAAAYQAQSSETVKRPAPSASPPKEDTVELSHAAQAAVRSGKG